MRSKVICRNTLVAFAILASVTACDSASPNNASSGAQAAQTNAAPPPPPALPTTQYETLTGSIDVPGTHDSSVKTVRIQGGCFLQTNNPIWIGQPIHVVTFTPIACPSIAPPPSK